MLGAPQFWSSFDADGERAALVAAGFELAFDSIETIIEDGRPPSVSCSAGAEALNARVFGGRFTKTWLRSVASESMGVRDKLNSAADVEVIVASPEQEPVLANLLELYVHDFSEFMDLKLGPDGRFGYKSLPLYWKEANRYPFLVMANGHLAGFVFVRGGSAISDEADVWDMAEFFIVRGFRRQRVGTQAAQEIWKRFPGKWEVRVTDRNEKARNFWDRAVGEFLGKPIKPIPLDEDGEGWHIFSFESHGSA